MARNQLGYTLVELLVVTALMLLLLLGVSTLLIASLTSDARITMRQELRAEGNYAMDTMSYFIRNAKSLLDCNTPGDTLTVNNEDRRESQFLVVPNGGYNQIASYSAPAAPLLPERRAFLTQAPYEVSNFSMDCNNVDQQQPYVTISFTLTRTDVEGDPINNDFRHTVLVRNR